MKECGLIHLYYGSGKGKTTAAMGLALRCLGHGQRVVIAQFLKDGTSGECLMLKDMENVTFFAANPSGKFTAEMSFAEKAAVAEAILDMFQKATDCAVREDARLLILDEICVAVSNGFLKKNLLLNFLDNRPKGLEVVLTGRDPLKGLLERADYVTEMLNRRHPFDRGIYAREGIEL